MATPKQLFREKLRESGLTEADAKKLGMKLYTPAQAKKLTAKHKDTFNQPSLYIPYHEVDGKPNHYWRLRRLEPPRPPTGSFSAAVKRVIDYQRYTQPGGTPPKVYLPPLIPWKQVADTPEEPLLITEGELKAASGCKLLKRPVLALGGVWSWRSKKSGQAAIPDLNRFTWLNRVVYLVWDADVRIKTEVKIALTTFARELTNRGAIVRLVNLPEISTGEEGDTKTGLDDFLVHKGVEAFEELLDESDHFGLSDALHALNTKVVFVRHPASVIEQRTSELMSVDQFKTVYAPYKFYAENAAGNMVEKKAPPNWLEWPHRLEVERLVYEPGQPTFLDSPIGEPLYNLWPGWGVEPVEGDTSPWRELLDYIFEHHTESRLWFERWCAFQFQQPGIKAYSAVIATGRAHGTGKSLVGETLRAIFGKNGALVDQDQLTSPYNRWAERKQFILGDEITGIEKRKEADKIKTLITRPAFEVNAKYMPTYELEDKANWYLTTNHADAFVIEDSDRRFFVWSFPPEPLHPNFYNRYDDWLKGSGPAHLFHYFLNFDLGDFDHRRPPPATEAKREMAHLSKTDVEAWAADLRDSPDTVLTLDGAPLRGDLFTITALYELADAAGIRIGSLNSLSRALTNAGFPGTQVIRIGKKTFKVRPVRNLSRWREFDHKAWATHYEETRGEGKKKKFR